MTFSNLLKSLIWRNLQSLNSSRYYAVDVFEERPYNVDVPLQPCEIIMGLYENVVDTLERAIVLTTHGLYLNEKEGWHFIGYKTIESVTFPKSKELHEPKSLAVSLQNGTTIALPIEGQPDPIHRPHLRDVWVFGRFLELVIQAAHDTEKFPAK
jgi:hypothetical protein